MRTATFTIELDGLAVTATVQEDDDFNMTCVSLLVGGRQIDIADPDFTKICEDECFAYAAVDALDAIEIADGEAA